ncbi:hypothetical protein DDZ14_00755 [Maritimibacter sp. 55A14]|uniref:hypothetical protein n=1 Tax=Maritimibacter sp. 55A14 TaxID=2174844 RepID=UPI000D618B58|nr:hypothetical protein [Maritimibacter sp. 55A14]PWE34275.1 hypothetical protein DDZ14_00755 [Maritimibacter sp. 55A14]
MTATAGLWLAVIASGLYHGVNPGMGWPLAVSAALMEGGRGALWRALAALAVGHFAAMLAILLPFAAMNLLVEWQREIRIGAGGVVIALGLWLLVNRRHPRFLARIPPARLALWSFLVATAHGAGLMLVPIYLGLCGPAETDTGHMAAAELMARNAGVSLGVALVHTVAMIGAGGAVALAVHHWLGLKFLSRSWFNLDILWALSLIAVGGIALATAI